MDVARLSVRDVTRHLTLSDGLRFLSLSVKELVNEGSNVDELLALSPGQH